VRSGTVASVGYGTLLFLHVLGAFALVAAVALFLAILLAVRRQPDTMVAQRMLPTARVLWAVGGLSALVFGIWLAIRVSQYSLTDGWILGAIVLWVIASAIGGRLSSDYKNLGDGALGGSQALVTHGLLVLSVLLLLLDMIYKPGAG
jgi:tellurite resistance protein TehA-like permease